MDNECICFSECRHFTHGNLLYEGQSKYFHFFKTSIFSLKLKQKRAAKADYIFAVCIV